MIDLRSDTVTRPTPEMRRAMADAEVGDDVFDEDPTTQLLQREVAALLGKEAALFVPSGTMANQIATFFESQPGDQGPQNVAGHINKFWEPRMRAMLIAHLDAGGAGLDPTIVSAASLIRRPKAQAA
jgi:threonine aldolase